MKPIQDIKSLFADQYYQAALAEAPMERLSKIFEEVRSSLQSTGQFYESLNDINRHLGFLLKEEGLFQQVNQLKSALINWRKTVDIDRLQKVEDHHETWDQWLAHLGESIAYLRNELIGAHIGFEFEVPADHQEDYAFIKKSVPFVIKECWPESYALIDWLIDQPQLSEDSKIRLRIIAIQIQIYFLLDFPEALSQIELLKQTGAEPADIERLYGMYHIQQQDFEPARNHLEKALDLDDEDAENYMAIGDLYRAQNMASQAETWYRKGIEADPGKAFLYDRLIQVVGSGDEEYYKVNEPQIEEWLVTIQRLEEDFLFSSINAAGFSHQQHRNYDAGQAYFERLLEEYPDRFQGYTSLGYLYLELESYEKSLDYFNQSISLAPEAHDGFEGYWGRIALYKKLEDWESAIDDLRKASALRPSWNRFIFNDLAYVYERSGQLDNAIAYYASALGADPLGEIGIVRLHELASELGQEDLSRGIDILDTILETIGEVYEDEYHNRVGVLYYKHQQYEQAVQHYQIAIAERDDDPIYFENLGLAYENLGEIEKAAAAYEGAVELATEDEKSGFLNRLGVLWHDAGFFEKAILYYNQAINQEVMPLYFENRGLAYQRISKVEEAEKDFQQAVKIGAPENAAFLNRLAYFYIEQERYQEAIPVSEESIAKDPQANYYENLGYALEKLGHLEAAQRAYENALDATEEYKDVYLNRLGIFYYNQGIYDQAIAFYEKAIDLVPDRPVYWDNLGLVYEQTEAWQKAEEKYLEANRVSGHASGTYLNQIGVMYYRAEQYQKAITFFKQAIAIDPNADYYESLGLAHEQLGQMAEAKAAFEKAIEVEVEDPGRYINRLGFFLSNQGALEEAITLFKQAISIKESPVYAENLGYAYEQQAQFDLAESAYQQSLSWAVTDEDFARYHNRLGVFYFHQGDNEKAINHYNAAIDYLPQVLYFENLLLAFETVGDIAGIEHCYLKLDELSPKSGFYLFKIGHFLIKETEMLEKGVAFLEQAIQRYQETTEIEQEESEVYNLFSSSDEIAAPDKVQEVLLNLHQLRPQSDLIKVFLGNWFYNLEAYDQAIHYYQQAYDQNSNIPDYAIKLGEALIAGKQTQAAVQLFDEYGQRDPEQLERFARAYYDQGDYQHAQELIQRAIAQFPDRVIYRENLAITKEALGEYEEAIENYRLVIQALPESEKALYYNKVGNMYYRLGRYEEAIAAYEEAIFREGDNAVYFENLALMYEKKGNFQEALIQMQKALSLNPSEVFYIRRMGEFYQAEGQLTMAIDQFKQVLEHQPNDFFTLELLAKAYQEDGLWEEAVATYQHLIEIAESESRDIYHNLLGNLYYQMEAYQRAIDEYEKAIKLRPDVIVYYENISLMYEVLEDWPNAIHALQEAAKRDPGKAIHLNRIGKIYYRIGELTLAKAAFEDGVKNAPHQPESYSFLAELHLNQEQFSDAVYFYEQAAAVAEEEDKAYFFGMIGVTYRESDQYFESKEAFQQALGLAVDGQKSGYFYGVALACRGLNQYDEAIDALELAIADEQIEKDIYYNYLGNLYLEIGLYEQALDQYEAAINVYPKQPIYYDNLAYAHEMMGDVEQAELAYLKALNLSPNNGLYYYRLADLQLRFFSNTHKALNYFIKALELSPNNHDFLNDFIETVFRLPLQQDQLRFFKRAQSIPGIDHLKIRDALKRLKDE